LIHAAPHKETCPDTLTHPIIDRLLHEPGVTKPVIDKEEPNLVKDRIDTELAKEEQPDEEKLPNWENPGLVNPPLTSPDPFAANEEFVETEEPK
jgi:hypothetical protein